MLPSPRFRAKSRLNSRPSIARANSRLRASHKHQPFWQVIKNRHLLHVFKTSWRLISQLMVLNVPVINLNFQALGLSLFGCVLGYLLLSRIAPTTMAGWPTMTTYWPVVVLIGWCLFWLLRGLGCSTKLNYATTITVVWWLWLRLQHVATDYRIILFLICLTVTTYFYIWAGEKYLFSRKSIRKGILR